MNGSRKHPGSAVPSLSSEERVCVRELMGMVNAQGEAWKAAYHLLNGTPPAPELLASLVDLLKGPDCGAWREQALAAWALGVAPLTPEQKAVAALWEQHVLRYYHSLGSLKPLRRAYIRILPLTAAIVFLPGTLNYGLVAGALGIVVLNLPATLLFWPISAMIDRNRVNRVRAEAVRALGRLAIPQTVETVAAAVTDPCRMVQERAIPALINVLPTLTADYDGMERQEALQRLCRLAHHWFEPLAIAVIEALGRVGGGSVLPTAERLAKRGRTAAIQEAAQSALPAIEARAYQERESVRLLRPTECPQAPETLLRPAEHSGAPNPAVLLRSALVDVENSE